MENVLLENAKKKEILDKVELFHNELPLLI